MQINQFHDGAAVGDAITNQMLAIKSILIEAGYESDIYATHVPTELAKDIKNISKYRGSKDNILFIHHSMGFDLFNTIIDLPDKKAMIYHNITPEKFFADEQTKVYIRKGLKQAKDYKNSLDYFIADSNYNRRELIKMGHRNIDVMPVQISLNRFENITSDSAFKEKYANTNNVLFVGRIVPNKCQHDILTSFYIYTKYFAPNARLLFVGDTAFDSYVNSLKKTAESYGITKKVCFLGKVSEKVLKACYEVADVFVCMSEHEGFGVPLLEAMALGVPVVALNSSAIPETMDGAGILVTKKNHEMIGALLNEVISDKELNKKLIEKQYERIERLRRTDTKKILCRAIECIKSGSRSRSIQLQGPFETSYSLAIVNRKLIEAMDDLQIDDVSIYCTEGPGDYEPKLSDLKDKPNTKRLWEKSKNVTYPDITIRQMYPPRVADVNGGLNFQFFGWEESIVPSAYVEDFNRYLSGVGTMSNFVTSALIASGLTIPVKTIGVGVQLPDNFEKLTPYHIKTKKQHKFLHISSAFPRKGVDILLEAYYAAFTGEDDVCLILKTFPNPHNNVEEQIAELNRTHLNPPEVELINKDLPSEMLYSMYKINGCCYVHVARGEGFGLPVAEAMLAKMPVIVSPNTGMADFCNENTALLVDYEMEFAHTHLSTENSMWAKPNHQTLQLLMKKYVDEPETLEINSKIEMAYQLISEKYSWEQVARRWYTFIDEVESIQEKPKVAMVTTWNNKCGIAEFTRFQVEEMRNHAEFSVYPNYAVRLLKNDELFVRNRLWHSAFEGNMERLTEELLKNDEEIVHFQFNFGFFDLKCLEKSILDLCDKKKVIITFHKTQDAILGKKTVSLNSINGALNRCAKLIVHQQEDRARLEKFGVNGDLVEVLPLGQIVYKDYGKQEIRKKLGLDRSLILGSYGFLLPQKGIKQAIKAISLIKEKYPDVLYIACCALHESTESQNYYEQCKELMRKLGLQNNIVFITEYLPNDESMIFLQACDITLMTYLPSKESASGAIRFCVAALRPLITTKQDIFKEFEDCTYQIENSQPTTIADAVFDLCDARNQKDYIERMQAHIDNTCWKMVSGKLDKIYRECLE